MCLEIHSLQIIMSFSTSTKVLSTKVLTFENKEKFIKKV